MYSCSVRVLQLIETLGLVIQQYCENSLRLSTIDYFTKELSHRCLTGFLILLRYVDPTEIYLLKVKNETLRQDVKYFHSKLTIKTPERRQWRDSGVFIVNFE